MLKVGFVTASLFQFCNVVQAAPVIDGVFDLAAGEWNGFSVSEDYVRPSDGFVGPGWGGQDYDVEHLGYNINSGSETVMFGLQTGHNLGTDSANELLLAGDFAIDLLGNGLSWDLAITFDINADNSVGFELFDMRTTGAWEDVLYPAHSAANPWRMDPSDKGTSLGTFSGFFGSAIDHFGNDSYVLEGAFDLTQVTGLTLADFNATSVLHWTMACGNDYLNSNPTAPVPEPATTLLFSVGVAGFATVVRRRKKQ